MKHIKKLNDSAKKAKNARKLEMVALWLKEITKSCIYGFIVFCALLFITSNTSVSIFLGAFTAYMFIGFKIYERSNPIFGFDFSVYHGKFSLLIIVVAIIAIATSSPVTIITWPLLATGVVLLVAAALGVFGISFTNYYEE